MRVNSLVSSTDCYAHLREENHGLFCLSLEPGIQVTTRPPPGAASRLLHYLFAKLVLSVSPARPERPVDPSKNRKTGADALRWVLFNSLKQQV